MKAPVFLLIYLQNERRNNPRQFVQVIRLVVMWLGTKHAFSAQCIPPHSPYTDIPFAEDNPRSCSHRSTFCPYEESDFVVRGNEGTGRICRALKRRTLRKGKRTSGCVQPEKLLRTLRCKRNRSITLIIGNTLGSKATLLDTPRRSTPLNMIEQL